METTNELLINGYYADTESYIRCAGIETGEYVTKIDSSCIMDFEAMIQEQINNEMIKQINRIYIPEKEEDKKYTPDYRLGFL